MDDIIIGLKNLAITLAGEGINYVVDSVADMIIPKHSSNAKLKLNVNEPFQVTRIISAKGSDGTNQDFTINLTVTPNKKMLLGSDGLSSKTLISNIVCTNDSSKVVKLSHEDFIAECKCTLVNSTNDRGGISVLNGIIEITW